jgi:hypothetical protein
MQFGNVYAEQRYKYNMCDKNYGDSCRAASAEADSEL